MEAMIIGVLVVWIGVSTVLAGVMARNGLPRLANVALITIVGYLAVLAGLYFLLSPMVPRSASAMSLLGPIAIAGAVAAAVAAGLSYLRIGQVRRKLQAR